MEDYTEDDTEDLPDDVDALQRLVREERAGRAEADAAIMAMKDALVKIRNFVGKDGDQRILELIKKGLS